MKIINMLLIVGIGCFGHSMIANASQPKQQAFADLSVEELYLLSKEETINHPLKKYKQDQQRMCWLDCYKRKSNSFGKRDAWVHSYASGACNLTVGYLNIIEFNAIVEDKQAMLFAEAVRRGIINSENWPAYVHEHATKLTNLENNEGEDKVLDFIAKEESFADQSPWELKATVATSKKRVENLSQKKEIAGEAWIRCVFDHGKHPELCEAEHMRLRYYTNKRQLETLRSKAAKKELERR